MWAHVDRINVGLLWWRWRISYRGRCRRKARTKNTQGNAGSCSGNSQPVEGCVDMSTDRQGMGNAVQIRIVRICCELGNPNVWHFECLHFDSKASILLALALTVKFLLKQSWFIQFRNHKIQSTFTTLCSSNFRNRSSFRLTKCRRL